MGEAEIFEYSRRRSLESDRVCCLADIPVSHLDYHGQRYGKMGVGFYREAIHKHGFNPVFYVTEKSHLLSAVYKCAAILRESKEHLHFNYRLDANAVAHMKELETESPDIEELRQMAAEKWRALDTYEVFDEIEKNFKLLLAYTKSFSDSEFDTIFTEREWRSTRPFKFSLCNIAMIVAPKSGRTNHYRKLVETAKKLGLPSTIPIVPWEDLVEH